MELDARRLRVLREVALRGTITAAAGTLGFTPSAVSQQLSALERESGTALLERTGRQVRLTDAGRLRVAASGSVARALVIPVAAALADECRELRVTVLEFEPEDSLRELRLGALDLVVAHEYDHDRRPPAPDLVRVDLFEEDLLLAAP